jgi:hypothetical protein
VVQLFLSPDTLTQETPKLSLVHGGHLTQGKPHLLIIGILTRGYYFFLSFMS